jgi:rhodanese-related sulfurtransferase
VLIYRKLTIPFLCIVLLGGAAPVLAEDQVVSVEQVTELMAGGRKAYLIDVRSFDEYRSGHIPGAVSIPAERIAADRGRLPRDRAANLIFYCRGAG